MYLYVPSHTQIISLSRDKIQSIWTFQIQLDLVDRSAANHISRDAVLQERKGNDHCSFPIARQRRKAIAKNPSHKPLCNQSGIRGVTIWTTLHNNNRWPGPICERTSFTACRTDFCFVFTPPAQSCILDAAPANHGSSQRRVAAIKSAAARFANTLSENQ